jgi:ankyrin repeat protein
MELMEAVRDNNLDAVNRLLLNPRIDVNATDDDGDTALIVAADNGRVDIGRRLLQSGADVNKGNPRLGYTPLMGAATIANRDFVVLLLEQDGISVNNASVMTGRTALILAFHRLSRDRPAALEIIEMLLGSGADPNVISLDGETALNLAVGVDDVSLAKLLVENGADINQHILVRNNQTILIQAAWGQAFGILTYLLSLPNIDIDATTNDGRTALMSAVQSSILYSKRVVQQLIAAGADPLVVDLEGKTARDYATDPGISEVLHNAEDIWLNSTSDANRDLQHKFLIAHRLRTNETLPVRQLGDNIIQRSEYDNLCVGLQNNLNKPGVIALARSLRIPTTGQTKIALCKEIATKLIK